MSGEPEVYQQARRILLDALEALGEQRSAIVLVGAQAVYLHTGDADIAVAPYTTDADVAIDPAQLGASPLIEAAMRGGGFHPGANPGSWIKEDIAFDLMVPAALAGGGRRGADLGVHGCRAARKARGLEGALVDKEAHEVAALAQGDLRRFTILVAGPGALLVAKLHKIAERVGAPSRTEDKDALDVLRLLRSVEADRLGRRVRLLLESPLAGETASEAISHFKSLFGTPESPGSNMAARAVAGLDDPDTIRASCAALAEELLTALAQ
ncbi:hypothetical protein AMPC_16890 [Anaeromyxobacter paludicola]|uniref:Nucleotidyltransferase n=1 Tax=Anaeromyxobacter paludicola TaxID=2918171 RepID=A0ABN6N5Y4_9BACT|nr:hypothetical protein AMPC_16890 [Anaeromyxobacter paludicola]